MTPARVTLVCLAVAASAFALAWQMQSSAAAALLRAQELQQAEVPEDEGPPPKVQDYRDILTVLQESLEVRKRIDGLLTEVEGAIAELRTLQTEADEISTLALEELEAIAATLGGAIDAAGGSLNGLRSLDARLNTSERLARLIAEELEELDRKLGP